MKPMSRREFLRRLAAGAGGLTGALILQACSQMPPENPSPTQIHTLPATAAQAAPTALAHAGNIATPANTAAVAAQAATLAPTPPGIPDLVVARGGEPEALVTRALAALGGIERFVKSGDDVIIKPNICVANHTYEYAATTNPWVVAALVKLCLGAGARQVRVMDYPFNGTAQEAYEISGIRKEVEAAGGKMEYMTGYKYKKVAIPNAKSLKSTKIYGDILTADVVIDVPVAKNHDLAQAKLTLGMKNLMGLVADRAGMHYNLDLNLADLASLVKPKLTVVDAVRIMTHGGPTGGDLNYVKKLDTIIASADIVAADSYAATLFGMKPTDIPYIVRGAEMGLGINDLSSLKIQELTVGA